MQIKKSNLTLGLSALLMVMAAFLSFFTFRTINQVFFNASVDQNMETLEIIRDLGIKLIEGKLSDLQDTLNETARDFAVSLSGTPKEQTRALKSLSLPDGGLSY